MDVGYWLSSEEHAPRELVQHAVWAEEAGFAHAMISDHFHPWVPAQGQSPFVWSVLGAIAASTERLHVGTGVSATVRRVHPVVLAHAAATTAAMMPGRFFLGLGTGERLNEQVVGRRWPRPGERRHMLEEAIGVIRALWDGGVINHDGRWFRVEGARLFTRPDVPPPILVAASGRRSAEVAGRLGDGLIAVAPDERVVEVFEASGGDGKPRAGQLHVCWAATEEAARRTAREWWPVAAVKGAAMSELSRPSDYAALVADVDEAAVARAVVCGPDVDAHLAALRRFAGAGFTRVYVHQVGPDQRGFLDFYREQVVPALR
jgi:coenzyme F420-dependent glucose-6-phosphate dehydrogenase